jgi:ABC-type glycerol-3-phosphate transport system substrate-binding protein
MIIRNVAIALVAAALLAGCGSDTAPAPAPSPTPTASDEEQIRDVLTEATEATGSWDAAKMAVLVVRQVQQ